MIRKLIGLIAVLLLIGWGLSTLWQSEENKPVISDVPTEQEQKVIEETQPEPEFVPESEMENQSPENAEKDS